MASNLKGRSGIKGLLLLHCEKLIIGIAGLLALWFVYSSLQLPKLEAQYQAGELEKKVTAASNEVKNFSWDDAVRDHADQVKIANLTVKKDISVDVKKYATSPELFDRPIVAPTVRRTDPVMLNAVDVFAIGGSGLFAFTDEKIRDAQELERAREEAELAKKLEDKAKREAEQSAEGNRNRAETEDTIQPLDPDHPDRQSVQGLTRASGVMALEGDRIERAYWATVVAKVPIREQLKLNQDAFEKARLGFDPERDFPEYKGYRVQRAEVVRGKPLEWKSVPVFDGQRQSVIANKFLHPSAVAKPVVDKLEEAAMQFWSGGVGPDVVDPRYTDRNLTLPLPPLVGREWGAGATHPDIPLAVDTPPLEDEVAEEAEQKPAEPAETDENAAFRDDTAMVPGGPGGGEFGARMPVRPGFRPMARGSHPEGGERMSGRSGRRMSAGPEGGGRQMGGAASWGGPRTSLTPGVNFLLLRFFDFTVEPGKKYKYRVQLVLKDPNYMVDQNSLATEVVDRQIQAAKASGGKRPDFRLVENWSDPSPTVGIPLAGSVRVASAKWPDPKRVNDEPLATLLVESFDVDEKGNAVQAANLKELRRGAVANMVEETWYLGPDQLWIDKMESFKFLTGVTVVDLVGGDKLTKDMTVPVRVLLMGSAGDLYIRNELDDKAAVDYHKFLFDEKAIKKRAKGGASEGGMGPEGGGSRGRGPQ